MGVFHPYPVRCNCGCAFLAPLADSINAELMPDLRVQIIRGEMHRFTCPNCQEKMTIEKELLYTDFSRNTVIKVMPRKQRFRWKEASEFLESDLRRIPTAILPNNRNSARVVFGLGELREKLIAQDAGIDDRMIELLKVLLIYEHPFLIQTPKLRMDLDEVTNEKVQFVAYYDHKISSFLTGFSRPIVDDILEKEEEMKKWVGESHKRSNIFSLKGDYWINFRRWSPRPWALDQLRDSIKKIRQHKKINVKSVEFRNMIKYLPRGSGLQPWAKRDLRELYLYAKRKKLSQLQDKLFEIRFGIELEDDWALNDDPDDIDTLWKLLHDLPDTNVEGNSFIDEIYLEEGKKGARYQPLARDIFIGSLELSKREWFQDIVRHEVAHAVYHKYEKIIEPWLASQFGWKKFRTNFQEFDQWVSLMGGWGELTSHQKVEVLTYLVGAMGQGRSWNPGPSPNPPSNHPWFGNDFGPRLAYEKTKSDWYETNDDWYRFDGKAFFLNYYYQEFMVVNEDTLKLINTVMPNKYAAMSPLEFFAEVYALYYDVDDSRRTKLPPDVVNWFDNNIGNSEGGNNDLKPIHTSISSSRKGKR